MEEYCAKLIIITSDDDDAPNFSYSVLPRCHLVDNEHCCCLICRTCVVRAVHEACVLTGGGVTDRAVRCRCMNVSYVQ